MSARSAPIALDRRDRDRPETAGADDCDLRHPADPLSAEQPDQVVRAGHRHPVEADDDVALAQARPAASPSGSTVVIMAASPLSTPRGRAMRREIGKVCAPMPMKARHTRP